MNSAKTALLVKIATLMMVLAPLVVASMVVSASYARTQSISVSASDSTFTFGTNPLSTWLTPQTSVITNNGAVAENFIGRISQFSEGAATWGLSSTDNGDNIIRAQWSTTGENGPWNDISAYDTDFTIATNVAVNDSVSFWFRIETPASTSSYTEYSSVLTITALAY